LNFISSRHLFSHRFSQMIFADFRRKFIQNLLSVIICGYFLCKSVKNFMSCADDIYIESYSSLYYRVQTHLTNFLRHTPQYLPNAPLFLPLTHLFLPHTHLFLPYAPLFHPHAPLFRSHAPLFRPYTPLFLLHSLR